MSWPYLLYLGLIFVPGIGFSELLSLWKKGDGVSERLAFSFALGLAIDTIILMVRTSGLSIGAIRLLGLEVATIYLIIAAGALALTLSFVIRRRFGFIVKPTLTDLAMSLIIAAQAFMVLLHFQKYPIFPAYPSEDYGNHVQFARGLITGSLSSIPSGLLYFGVHYQLASGFLLEGGEDLVVAQRVMGLLVVLSPLLVFLAAKRLTNSGPAALLVALTYTFTGFLWFDSVFNSGLYANFFGFLASLFFIVCYAGLIRAPRAPFLWVAFLLSLIASYFSHYTFVTLLPALLAVPAINALRERRLSIGSFFPALVAVSPGAVAFITYPSLLSLLVTLAMEGGGRLYGSTALSTALSSMPVLSYMALLVYDDVGFLLLFILGGLCLYKAIRSRDGFLLLPFFWLLSLLLTAPRNVSAWRFSYEGLIPLLLMAGYGFYLMLPKKDIERRRRGSVKYLKFGLVFAVLFALLTVNSWSARVISDALTDTDISASAQQDVYQALYWLRDNTPDGARYLSVSDWRFRYSSLFFGRVTEWVFFSYPSDAINYARQHGIKYIVVTKVVTADLPPIPSLFPWNNFNGSSSLSLIYSNDDVRIFELP